MEGKPHLLIALGAEAAMAGYRVKYILAASLVNELVLGKPSPATAATTCSAWTNSAT